MKRIFPISLLLIAPTSFAIKPLVPPNNEASIECIQAYDKARQPKMIVDVRDAMQPICLQKGGFRVLHKMITLQNVNNPSGLMLTCIGNNPDDVLFSCQYPLSTQDL